jgi:hypothetical protein
MRISLIIVGRNKPFKENRNPMSDSFGDRIQNTRMTTHHVFREIWSNGA